MRPLWPLPDLLQAAVETSLYDFTQSNPDYASWLQERHGGRAL